MNFSLIPDCKHNTRDVLGDLVSNYQPANAEKTALTFLDGAGELSSSMTYRQLSQRCKQAAASLQTVTRQGQVALIAVENNADFVTTFFGCLLAGIIAVPVSSPRGPGGRGGISRVHKIADVAAAEIVITDTGLLRSWSQNHEHRVQLIDVDRLRSAGIDACFEPVFIAPSDTAYLQYTSGSTSTPKGVRLSHANVLAHLTAMLAIYRRPEEVRVAGWLPLYHDMGLVGHLLSALFENGSAALLPPASFLSNPEQWFKTIYNYQANVCAAPTFAFEYCLKKITGSQYDLSSLESVYVGSEFVALKTLDEFSRAFAKNGFKKNSFVPVYGLAEATLLVAGGSLRLPDLEKSLIDYSPSEFAIKRQLIGYPLNKDYFNTLIINDDTQVLEESNIGEVVISGASVTDGYWRNCKEQNLTIKGRKYFKTGDQGFIKNDRLYLTGRKKDIIIVRGVNYCAEDLEFSVTARLGKHHGETICFAVSKEHSEELIVVQETYRHIKAADASLLENQIKAAITADYGITPKQVIFIAEGTVPRTANHKISRSLCRTKYEENSLVRVRLRQASEKQAEFPKAETREPVAIVSMACRFPGGADSPEKFWELLSLGKDAISEVPAERWNNELFYSPEAAVPGKTNTRWAGFIDGIDQFDPQFFGISSHEAAEIDPQQRLLLETTWRLMEDNGLRKEDMKGSDTGVFVGISTNDYLYMKIKLMPGMDSFNAYSGLGNANSIAANRISYLFDLKGPSIAVDTACSSSLTALHLAAQSIINCECSQAIAGGVNAIISPGPTISLSQFGMMSPDGRCKAFDQSADGYVRAEGCGLVLLKTKSAALRNRDHILGYIRASSLGQDGRSSGISHPNSEAQGQLIERTLKKASISPADISYLEAHATGTVAGDPVEINKLRDIYGHGWQTCHIGSVKASIGHLEAGAGIASVIKVLLMMRQKQIPPQIHLNKVNPAIDLDHSRFKIPIELTSWKANSKLTAGVSSFGFGGALVHMILEEAERKKADIFPPKNDVQLFTLSAIDSKSLVNQAESWVQWLEAHPEEHLARICYTQAQRRSVFPQRYFATVNSKSALLKDLSGFISHKPYSAIKTPANPVFLFTGQGTHYPNMGQLLYDRFEVFNRAFSRCSKAFNVLTDGPDLEEALFQFREDLLNDPVYSQCHHFSIQYALSILWLSLGISPEYVIGYSLGEYAAAATAGCLTPEDGIKLLFKRGELVKATPEGAMAIICRSADKIRQMASGISIAAENSPAKTVIAGTIEEVGQVLKTADADGIQYFKLNTNRAYHSRMMDKILDSFEKYASRITFKEPLIPWISTVTGKLKSDAPSSNYWRNHLWRTVLLGKALEEVKDSTSFIELGPGCGSLVFVSDTLVAKNRLLLRSMDRPKANRTETVHFLNSLGELFAQGHTINWNNFYSANEKKLVRIPKQNFNKKRYWIKGALWDKLSTFAGASDKGGKIETLFRVKWFESPLQKAADTTVKKTSWIVIGNANTLTQEIVRELKGKQQQVYWIQKKSSSHSSLADFVIPDECTKEQYLKIFKKITNSLTKEVNRNWKLIYCNGLNCKAKPSADSLEVDQNLSGPGDLTRVTQAVIATGEIIPLSVITSKAQLICGDDFNDNPAELNISQSPLWGFGKTLFLEHPELRGGLIDLEESTSKPPVDLLTQLLHHQQEKSVAFRKGKRFIAKVTPHKEKSLEKLRVRNNGVYIITGGLGGLGLKSSQWLLDKGATNIILLGRSGLPPKKEWLELPQSHKDFNKVQAVIAMEKQGASISIVRMDIRDTAALSSLFEKLKDERKPVRGVIHAAGVNWFAKIRDIDTTNMLLDTLKTNISAAWSLHELTADCDLDCFILYSSVSAIWGSVDLAHYTAANHFLDALSQYRSSLGMKTLSINWGPWDEVGMSSHDSAKKCLQQLGFRLMKPESALADMEQLILQKCPLALSAQIEWERFKSFIDFSLSPSLFSLVCQDNSSSGTGNPSSGNNLEDIRKLPEKEVMETIDSVIRSQLSSVMLIDSINDIDENHHFNFLGMDSLMAISFAVQLEQYLDLKMPTTLAYNYPTIRDVRNYIYKQIRETNPQSAPAFDEEAEVVDK